MNEENINPSPIIPSSNVVNSQSDRQLINQNPRLFDSTLSDLQMKIKLPSNDYTPQLFKDTTS